MTNLTEYEIFKGFGVPVTLKDPEQFLVAKETLSRIGIASKKDKILVQSVHLLHKRNLYVVLSFKELFGLDGKPFDFSEDDKARRNLIVNLLAEWGIVKLVEPSLSKEPVAPISSIKIVPFKEKKDWQFVTKYSIGNKKGKKE